MKTKLLMLFMLPLAAVAQPYNYIGATYTAPWELLMDGIGIHADNVNVPHATQIGLPDSWNSNPNGLQGNDFMAWHLFTVTDEMWYEFRCDNNILPYGSQTLIFPFSGNPSPLFNSWNPPYIFASGQAEAPPNGAESIIIYLTPGMYLVAVDGYGASKGKYHLRVRRRVSKDGSMPGPMYWEGLPPVNVQHYVD